MTHSPCCYEVSRHNGAMVSSADMMSFVERSEEDQGLITLKLPVKGRLGRHPNHEHLAVEDITTFGIERNTHKRATGLLGSNMKQWYFQWSCIRCDLWNINGISTSNTTLSAER